MTRHESSKEFLRRKKRRGESGFSLVELMVVLVISSFVLAAVYSVFTAQYRSWIARAQVSEMQENARTAMDMLVKDIRMAGFGMPASPVNYFANAINASNSGTNGTDSITVVTAYRQISTLAAGASKSDTTITLQDAAGAAKLNNSTKRYIYLDGVSQHDHYQVASISDANLTITSGLVRDYVAGTPVYLVRALTYSLDFTDADHPALRKNDNSGTSAQLIAENIEDLQFAYEDVDGNWHNNPPVPEDILAVRINVLARTDRAGNALWKEDQIGIRPAVEDHAAAGQNDGYRRRLLTTVVEARNMGL